MASKPAPWLASQDLVVVTCGYRIVIGYEPFPDNSSGVPELFN
jgi:hypothetical protein